MAISTEAKIAEGLFKRLSALTPALPIAWPNRSFTPPSDGKYLRVSDLPLPTRGMSLTNDGTNEYSGLLQVDVMWPLNDGEQPATEAAGAVIAHFKRGTRMDNGGIRIDCVTAYRSPALRDDPRWQVPVTVSYRAYAPNS
jgi:hypothetical protein